MPHRELFALTLLFWRIVHVAGQAAATTSNPLDQFIGAAGAAASRISVANAKEISSTSSSTSSSSSSTSSSTASTAAAAAQTSVAAVAHETGLSKGALAGIIIGSVVGALLILTLFSVCCCLCLRRRRQARRQEDITPTANDDAKAWKRPINPGRHYSNYSPAQHGHGAMEQHPTVPLMAAAASAGDYGRQDNRFLSHSGLNPPSRKPVFMSGATESDASPYMMNEKQPLRDRSRSSSRTRSGNGLPTTNVKNPNRPPTPMGLNAFGAVDSRNHDQIHEPRTASPPHHNIGQPYDDMHVHVLQTDAPSRELRHSPNTHAPSPLYAGPIQHRGYSTPPEVPTRSPNRTSKLQQEGLADLSYDSSTTDSDGQTYQRSGYDPYQPARDIHPWEHHARSADSGVGTPPAPPVPWGEEAEYTPRRPRRNSHSPRSSGQYRRSTTPRGSTEGINGQPRRLRFEDLQSNQVGRGLEGYEIVPTHGGHDSWDGEYAQQHRWSQGVGEAL